MSGVAATCIAGGGDGRPTATRSIRPFAAGKPGAAFFFFFFFFLLLFLAAAAFRSGILGRRVKPRVWEPEEEWLRQARKESTATFFVMMAMAWAYAAFNAVKSEIPGWLVAIAFLFMPASDSGKKPRRRRRAAW